MPTSNGYVLDERPDRLGELMPVPDAERDDRGALHRRLRADGYLFLRGALDPARVLRFREYYFGQLAASGLCEVGTGVDAGGRVDKATMRHALFGRIVPGEEYHAFCTQPALRDWYAWLFDGTVFLHRRKILRHLRPGEVGVGLATQAHYDLVYIREGTDRVLTSWIPLGDCPIERGGLIYLEGGHHRMAAAESAGTRRPAASITADLPSLAERYDTRWLLADYEPGDMVVHTAYTVHAALDNVATDGGIRLSTDIRYQREDAEIDARWQSHWHIEDGL